MGAMPYETPSVGPIPEKACLHHFISKIYVLLRSRPKYVDMSLQLVRAAPISGCIPLNARKAEKRYKI